MPADLPSAAGPPDAAAPERVIVVGGGIAGLVVARDIAAWGIPVILLEATGAVGGQVARRTVGGIEVDAAAESFASRGGAVAELATQLGLADDIVTPLDSPAWLYRADGRALPLPATSVLGIPGVPLASDVIDAIGLRAAVRAQLELLLPSLVGSRAVTLGELVRRRMGSAVLDTLVAPVVRGVHSASPDDLLLDRAVPGLRAGLLREGSLSHAVRSLRERAPAGSQVAGIRGGVSRLVDELIVDLDRFRVDVRTGVRVDAAEPGAVILAGGERLPGEVVIAAAGVVGPPPEARTITLVTLVVDSTELDTAPRGTGVLVAEGAPGVVARALTHATAKWPWLAERAEGRHVLRLSYDAMPERPVERAVADASTLLDAPVTLVDSAIDEWTRTIPGAHAVDGMHTVGEAGSSTGLAAVVASSRELAERILGVRRASEPEA